MNGPLKVAVLGCGSVGSQVVRLLSSRRRPGSASVRRSSSRVAVRRLDAPREVEVPTGSLTTDAEGLVTSDDVDLVIEVIGGTRARSLILAALESGKSVVTANKALLAEDGPTLFEAAAKAGRDLYYEAAVAGAIPIIRPLRESLAGDRVTRVLGIVNGTTNFILDKMDTLGAGYEETLAEAQELGYAEADPTADVDGFDAAAKAAILASLAFHSRVTASDVHREGIAEVTAADVASAAEMGSVVKLLAIAELRDGEDGEAVSVRVHPAMIPRSHPLASVRGAYNAVFVEADAAGQLMFYGPGAGGSPTAWPSSAISSRSPATGSPTRARRPANRRTPTGGCSRWGRRPRATTSRSTSTTARACSRPSPTRSPTTTCRSRPCVRRVAAPTRSSSWSRTPRPTPRCRPPSSSCVAWTSSAGDLGDARGRRRGVSGWRGVIEEYRDLVDLLPDDLEAITLREGGTPLVHSTWLSGLTGGTVWLKVEGANPTGSFKDRGMTTAISVAAHEGAEAVVCASTGNTSASMAAYAARAGLKPLVLIPEGKIAAGKLAQAVVHGAQIVMVRGNFDHCLDMARGLAAAIPSSWSTRSIPIASKARRPRLSKSSTSSATLPTSMFCPSATPATSRRTGRATPSTPNSAAPRSGR